MRRIFLLMLFVSFGCGGLDAVRDNLNDQRALYELPPVTGSSCEEVVLGFEDYVYAAIDQPLGETWDTIVTSECRTLQAHVDAFNSECDDQPYTPPHLLVERCLDLDAWR